MAPAAPTTAQPPPPSSSEAEFEGGIADWPGLADHDLYEGRDLRPTLDVVAVLKGVLHEHLHLTEPQLAEVFPAHRALAPQLEILS